MNLFTILKLLKITQDSGESGVNGSHLEKGSHFEILLGTAFLFNKNV